MFNSIDGKPCKMQDGLADRLNKAFGVFGIEPVCKQTESTLNVDGTKIRALKAYDTSKSIEVDHKISAAIKEVLKAHNVNSHKIYDTHREFKEMVSTMEPKSQLGNMGSYFSVQDVQEFLRKVDDVRKFVELPKVKQNLVEYDALQILFKSCSYTEVIK